MEALGGTRRVGGLLGVAGRLSGTVSPFRAEQGWGRAQEGSYKADPTLAAVPRPWGTPSTGADPQGDQGELTSDPLQKMLREHTV